MTFSSEDAKELTLEEWLEVFLAITIVALSTAFLLSGSLGFDTVVPLSLLFYGMVPGAMLVIAFLTLSVAREIYDSEDLEDGKFLPASLMALLLGYVSVNIGFIAAVSGSNVQMTGPEATLRVSLLLVILAVALSLSVIYRRFEYSI